MSFSGKINLFFDHHSKLFGSSSLGIKKIAFNEKLPVRKKKEKRARFFYLIAIGFGHQLAPKKLDPKIAFLGFYRELAISEKEQFFSTVFFLSF
ncbi:hypothetical protein A7Q10_08755 [Methylacidiphilum caldifontis]|uniref:Uncharacterized protein n=1 Tax=Methylacidiphilum caldifontis TaxID=2795386 RepID=A0A4Y8PAR5_9BACT|nr:hypothetical protein A7Q10_08755 [Methylacidiphilum caldifontis]